MTVPLHAVPDFRRIWLVGFVSFVVRWLEMLAIGIFAYRITGSAFVVAMLTMLRLLPMGLFGAFLGAAADRFERRCALVLVVAVSMGVSFGLAVLASLDAIAVWHLFVASFVSGICWAADNPVRRTMIGEVAGPDRMNAAMAFDVGTNNASRVLGPTLGGLMLGLFGIASVFWLGVALYAVSLAAALRLGMLPRAGGAPQTSFFVSLREGIAWVRRDRRLLGVFLVTVVFNVFGWPFTSMIPVIGADYLNLGPGGVGFIASCEGFGGLVGALLAGKLARPETYGRIYVGAVGAYLVSVIGFATAPNVAVASLALVASGMCSTCFAVMQATLVYRGSPVEMRARLLGVLTVCIGMGPIGFFYLGFLADVLTPRVGTVALAAQGVLALLVTRRWWTPAVRP